MLFAAKRRQLVHIKFVFLLPSSMAGSLIMARALQHVRESLTDLSTSLAVSDMKQHYHPLIRINCKQIIPLPLEINEQLALIVLRLFDL